MKELLEHSWVKPRTVKQYGKIILLNRCCISCGRDFAKEEGDEFGRAAPVGVFRIDILAEDVNEKWIGEGCPGKRFASAEGSPGTGSTRPPQRRHDPPTYR